MAQFETKKRRRTFHNICSSSENAATAVGGKGQAGYPITYQASPLPLEIAVDCLDVCELVVTWYGNLKTRTSN
jgi:hypothetical protein